MSDKRARARELARQQGKPRREAVNALFESIAPRYDLLNRLFSMRQDVRWRKRLLNALAPQPDGVYLDLAAGTGDVTLALARRVNCRVLALDLTQGMLQRLLERRQRQTQASGCILPLRATAEELPLKDHSVDGITIAFGVRNMPDHPRVLAECQRVLKPGARLVVLELAGVTQPFLRAIFNFYFHRLVPSVGRLLSGDPEAYAYLPESVEAFPGRDTFLQCMRDAGLESCTCTDLSFGIASLFAGEKHGC